MPGSMLMMVIEWVGKRVAINQAQGRVSGRAGEVGAQNKILIVPVYSLQVCDKSRDQGDYLCN